MGFATSLIDGLSSLMDGLGSALRHGFADYCDLETVDSDNTLVSTDGSLCTLVEVHGTQRLRSGDGVVFVVQRLVSSLQSMFESRGHALQAFFEVDPENTRSMMVNKQKLSRATIKRLGLDLGDVLDEREKVLSGWVSSERCFFVLWTTPDILVKSEKKEEKKARMERIKGKVITKNSQNPLAAVAMIRNRHESFVASFLRELEVLGIMAEKMPATKALREVRYSIDPGFTPPEWTPVVPGLKPKERGSSRDEESDGRRSKNSIVMPPSVRESKMSEQSWEIMWPRLGWQMCPRDANIVAPNQVQVGERVYSPMYIDLFQKDPTRFAALFSRAMDAHIPWRISFLVEGGGLDDFRFKGMAASLMGMVGSGNKAVDKTLKFLTALQNEEQTTIVQIRAALATWAPAGNRELLISRSSSLASAVGAWGGCQVSEVTGDEVAGLASTVPAFTMGSIGTKAACPLHDALMLLPLTRPSSPWSDGSVLFRSPDGKLMPFEPYSSKQTRWISLIFASPGSGKSVLMNSLNLALSMAPMNQDLPRIAIIDIGPSSSGLISLLKMALPIERRHEVVHKRLRMTEADAINPFDTQLGCRFPTSMEMQFLRNFISLLMTDPSQGRSSAGMSSIITEVINEMYAARSDKADPKLYARGLLSEVDQAIDKHGIQTDDMSTFWEVVDSLFEKGEYRAATIAQRHAVPLLQDAVTAVQGEKVKTALGEIENRETGEMLIQTFTRQIATLLNIFPILARPTAFDLGDARVAALDLDEVAKTGGPQADWQTGILYMLARQVMAKDFYLNEDQLTDMPAPPDIELRETVPAQAYKDYHRQRIRSLTASPKRICYDEFHRTSKCSEVRDQVLVDMREGRKFQVDVMLSSQSLEDFDDRMMEFASSIYVMDSGNASSIENLCKKFGFDDPEERYAIERRIHGPRAGGGTFLVQHQTTSGKYSMLLSNTLGPIELWAFSTTAEDVAIRNRLYEMVGPKLARQALSQMFPSGSAKSEVEERRERMKERMGSVDEEEGSSNIIEEITREVAALAERLRMNF